MRRIRMDHAVVMLTHATTRIGEIAPDRLITEIWLLPV
jgi:hypothetical protein